LTGFFHEKCKICGKQPLQQLFQSGNIAFQIWEPLKKSFGRVIAADMLGLGFSDKPVSNL